MSVTKSELLAILNGVDQIGTELEALNDLLNYLTSEIDGGVYAASNGSVPAEAFVGRVSTFCKMLFAVSTGFETQVKNLSKSVDFGCDYVKSIKEGA